MSTLSQALYMIRQLLCRGGRGIAFCCAIGIAMLTASASMANDGSYLESAAAPVKMNRVDYRDGRLTLSITDMSIVDLMPLIGTKANFKVVAYGDFRRQTGSWSFSDLLLAEAIKTLLRDTNAIVTYSRMNDVGNELKISKIYLLGTESTETNLVRINTVAPSLGTQLLVDQIKIDNSQDRVAAIDSLQGMTDEPTVTNLVFSLEYDPDPVVRSRAITALEEIGGVVAVTALETGLGDDDSSVRIKVVQALGKLEDKRISLWLGQILMGDSSVDVRLEAVKAMALNGDKTSRIFLEAATGDKSKSVREAAVRLLE